MRIAIRSQSRQSRRTVPTQRSATAFAFGARTGVRMISTPALRNTSSKTRLNLLSRSWIKKRIGLRRSGSDQASWRACCVVHSPSGFAVQPAMCTPPAAKFNEEQHIEASEPEGLNGEEVTGEHRLGVRAQELTPAEPSTRASGRHGLRGFQNGGSCCGAVVEGCACPEGAPPAHLALPDSGRTRFSKRFATEGATRTYYPHATRRPAIDAAKVAALLSRFAGSATRHLGRSCGLTQEQRDVNGAATARA
jgi:hypothetical protein